MKTKKIDKLFIFLLRTILFIGSCYAVILIFLLCDNLSSKIRFYFIDFRFYFIDIPLILSFFISFFCLFKKMKFIYILLLIFSVYTLIYLTFGKFNPY